MNSNIDLIVLGISSKGIEWVAEQLHRVYKDKKLPNLLMLTKGLSIHNNNYELLVDKLERLLFEKGIKEVMLIAQDLTYYGLDLYGKRNLAELLEKLSDVEGIEWIRLHYAFPSGFPMDVLKVMRERDNICNYIDIPLQHISDPMLKSMRRGTTEKRTNELLDNFRKEVPEMAIRTTLIAGYPGETEEDFQRMEDWVREQRFDRLGIFTYSHEENTHAYNLEDDVPEDIKNQRANRIMDIQSEISFQLNQEKVGKTFRVLFDRVEGDHFVGRTEFDSPEVDNEVLVPKSDYVRLGDFANVKIHRAEHFDLFGEIVPS